MPWPKGRPIPAEMKEQISAKLKGRPSPTKGTKASDETRAKLSAAHKGKRLSDEQKAMLSEMRKGAANPFAGRKHSEETRAAYSAARKGRPQPEGWRDQMRVIMAGEGNPMYGKSPTPEHREKLSRATKGRKLTPEQVEQRRRAGLRQAASGRLNLGEQAIAAVLDALGIEYEPQKIIGPYCVDFYVSNRNLVIECDGDFWHNRPDRAARDRKRDGWFRHHGYAVLRLDYTTVRRKPLATLTAALEALGA